MSKMLIYKKCRRGTPVHTLTVYGSKSPSFLARIHAHINESGLLTDLLKVYGFVKSSQNVQANER